MVHQECSINYKNAKPYDDKKSTNLETLSKLKANTTNLLKSLADRFDELMG